MTTITLTPEQVSLNLFYFGITFLLLGSIARRWAELKKVRFGVMQVPPIDGRHGKLEKALMYPLKIIGYVLAVSAIWVHVSYTPITYGLLISYVLVICVYVGIPFCFKPDKDFSVKDNWQIQRERLIAARGMYAITILFVPTSIFGNWCFGSFVLLSVFLYEVFVFSNKEQKNWEEYADFDIDHSEEIPRPTPSTE